MGKILRKIAIPVEQTYSHHIHIPVRCLFQVVSRQNSQPARIKLQRGVKPIFHAEIRYLHPALFPFQLHVTVKSTLNIVQTVKKTFILLQLL